MAYLYLDTSIGQLTGLMDDHFESIEWIKNPESKSSQFLHRQIYELLKKHSCEFGKLKGLIYCSGPGSYTGLRQTLSFAQILNLEHVPCSSFYHFEVPKLLGHKAGIFVSNAFKGETFLFQWNGEEEQKKLIKTDLKTEILSTMTSEKFSIDKEFTSTQELIESNSKEFFSLVIRENKQKDLYYYRDLEVEFKVSVGKSC
jgi:tRNA A37 threonylcarbamoyladenosine modification protein TsaB